VRDVSAAAAAGGVVAHAGGGGARVGAACAHAGGGLNGYTLSQDSVLLARGGHVDRYNPFAQLPFIHREDPTIYLHHTETLELIATLKGHSDAVRDVTFSSDRTLLLSGSDDGTVRLWRVPEFEE
jgi:WD40 repeat protein